MAARLHRPNQLEIARIFRIYRLDNFGELISIPERLIHSIPTVLYLPFELLKSQVGTCRSPNELVRSKAFQSERAQ